MKQLMLQLKGQKVFILWVLIVAFAATFIAIGSRWKGQGPSGPSNEQPKPKVTIGIQTSPAMALVMVAKDKQFFAAEGVEVELKEFTAGKFALQAFLSGSIDFAVSGEVPACLAILQGNDIRVVAQVVEKTVNEVRLVARKDGDTTDPKRYFKEKKRKLSTSFGGGPEMFTYSFLKQHGITDKEVEILSQRPEDMPAALETGSTDAIAIFDPFAFIAERRMADRAVTFSDAKLYSEIYVLNARPEQVASQARVIESLLAALARAGKFISSNPNEAKRIVQKYTKLDMTVIDGIWSNFVFSPAITQQLLDYWNTEAAWAKESGKIRPETKVPDFRTHIETAFLKRVAPSNVQLP